MKLCKDCKYFVKPSWWKKFTLMEFAEGCSHPELINPVCGKPEPCEIMRIRKCEKGSRFEMR